MKIALKLRVSTTIGAFVLATLFALPSLAQQTLPPQSFYFIGEGQVDIDRGTFLYSNTDIKIGPADSPGVLELVRYFGSRDEVGPFGYGWTHNFDILLKRRAFLEEPNGPGRYSYRYTVTIGRHVEIFVKDYSEFGTPPIYYEQGSGGYQVLTADSETGPFTYYGPNGMVVTFATLYDNRALVTSITQADGTKLTFGRGSAFTLISNNRGYAIGLETSNARVTKLCAINLAVHYVTSSGPCPAGSPSATYGYTADVSRHLQSFTDPGGNTTTYASDLTWIQSPGSATPDFRLTYHPISGKVFTQTLANGSVWTYHYRTESQTWAESEGLNGWTSVTDPQGNTVEYWSSSDSRPVKIRDELGRETLFGYTYLNSANFAKVPASETKPEGNLTQYGYAGGWTKPTEVRQVAKPGSGLADIVTTATYPTPPCTNPKICDKPLTTTDARGATTNFTYDPNHGGVLSEMKPPPAPGGARPLKLTSWVQRYGYVKNSSGNLVRTATPVWQVSSITECQTVAGGNTPSCDNGAPITTTTLEYPSGAAVNALLPRGQTVSSGGTSRRTCFGYDNLDRKISETSPNANLTSCP